MSAIADLLKILDLEPLERNLFRGNSPQVGWQRVFGGLVIAQSLVAASRTVDIGPPHSLHGYFLLPGDPSIPIIYEVDRIRDGKSFATRRVVAIQHGAAIFSMSASYHRAEPGYDHQVPMPAVKPPEDLPTEADLARGFVQFLPENVRRYWERERPIELRPTDLSRYIARAAGPPRQDVWIRATGALPDDPAIHLSVLAYASDMTLLDGSLAAHGKTVFDPDIQAASLDHAMWFHRPFRADDWLLYTQDSPSASQARGMARGLIFTRSGELVATVAQEGLIRPRPDRVAGKIPVSGG